LPSVEADDGTCQQDKNECHYQTFIAYSQPAMNFTPDQIKRALIINGTGEMTNTSIFFNRSFIHHINLF
jgi:hypothetical protein